MRTVFIAALFFTTALLLCAQSAHAWWCVGHMATSEIAKSKMQPATIAFVETVISSLKEMGPFPTTPDMTQVACWPDDLKSINLKMMGDWHFIDQPYPQVPGFTVPGGPIQNENVGKVINQLYAGIKSNKANPQGWAMGFAIANLIHFVGDIHQPLHATELFNEEYPSGDAGGNGEIVIVNNQQTNLHAIWDSVCWTWEADLDRPLSADSWTKLTTFTNGLLTKYATTFNNAQIGTFDPMVMAAESFEFALNTSYPTIVNNSVITQQYLDECLPVAEGRVLLGGLRLGTQLEFLLGKPAAEWAAAQKKAEQKGLKKLEIFEMPAEFHEAVVNKTYESLSFMKNRFELGLRLRAERLNLQHVKRNKQ